MEQRIELKHPAGKKAISIDKVKYDAIKKVLLNYLKTNPGSSHKEILQAIEEDFKTKKINFEGSVEWHMEWVKLDLEARKEIIRSGDRSPVKFSIPDKAN